MSKDPAFLFYDGDAARDVSHMNRLERGAYFDIIQAQRKFQGITVEQARKILGKDFDSCWSALELILNNDNGIYFIEWLRDSINKRKEYSDKQRKRIQDYWNKKDQEQDNDIDKLIPRNNHGNSTVIPHEDEIEDVNINIPYKDIVHLYHEILPMLPHVIKLSEKRKRQIKSRWFEDDKTQSLEWWKKFFTLIGNSKFLTGENDRGWKPDLEWITKQENFLKICEEKYNR
jgi:hypothetical protein